MYCFKKDLDLRWSAKQLLSHPWIVRNEKPKEDKKKKVEPPKKEEPKKVDLASKLAKFAKDEEDEEPAWPEDGEDEKWPDDDDEVPQTIVKGNDIVKKLQQLKLDDKKSSKFDSFSSNDSDSIKYDTVVKGNSIQRRIIAMNKKPQESIIQKEVKTNQKKNSWLDDDDDEEFSFAKGKKLTLQLNTKKDEPEDDKGFDEDLMELFQTESSGFDDLTQLKEVEAKQLYKILSLDSSDSKIREATKKLIELYGDPKLKSMLNFLVSNNCVIPILDVLYNNKNSDIVLLILKLLNMISKDDVPFQETLALVGGFPKIMKFSDIKYSLDIRNEASILICSMVNQDDTGKIRRSTNNKDEAKTNGVQMFISSGGLTVLSKFLAYDWKKFTTVGRDIIFRIIDLSLNVINLQVSRNHKRDFCRLLTEGNFVPPLSSIIANWDKLNNQLYLKKILSIYSTFSASGDSFVKLHMVQNHSSMQALYNIMDKVSEEFKLMIIQTLKNLSLDTTIQTAFVATGALKVLVQELAIALKKENIRDLESSSYKSFSQIVNALCNICGNVRVSNKENETIAKEGVVPLLFFAIEKKLPLHDFTLRLLIGFSHANSITRNELLKNDGVQFFYNCLSRPEFLSWSPSMLEAIYTMLSLKKKELEPIIMKQRNIDIISDIFKNESKSRFVSLLENFFKIINILPKVCKKFSEDSKFVACFGKHLGKLSDPKQLKNALKIISALFRASDNVSDFKNNELYNAVKNLSKNDKRLLVKKMAVGLLKDIDKKK
eukprot:gene7359-11681_t